MHDSGEATVTTERIARHSDGLANLCGEVAAIYRRAWGRGPVKTTAHWAGPNMIVIVLENGHTDAEKSLRATGHIQELMRGRRLLQEIVEDELRSSVERTIGRRVETVVSATRLDPDLSAELFLLAPADERRQAGAEHRLFERAADAAERAHALGDDARALEAQRRQVRQKIDARRQQDR